MSKFLVSQREKIIEASLTFLCAFSFAGMAVADSGPVLPEFVLGGVLGPAPTLGADRLVVWKSERRLVLYAGDEILAEYSVSLGRIPEGPKRELGDGRTPEGSYMIDFRKSDSDYYRALHISYPSDEDRRRAEERDVRPGGAIMIHGLPNGLGMIGSGHLLVDWTDGCIAVTNEEMDEIWSLVSDGVPIEIYP